MPNLPLIDAINQIKATVRHLEKTHHAYEYAETINGVPWSEIPELLPQNYVLTEYESAIKALTNIRKDLEKQLDSFWKYYQTLQPHCWKEHLSSDLQEQKYQKNIRQNILSSIRKFTLEFKFDGSLNGNDGYLNERDSRNYVLHLTLNKKIYGGPSKWYIDNLMDKKISNEEITIELTEENTKSRQNFEWDLLNAIGCADCILWEDKARKFGLIE